MCPFYISILPPVMKCVWWGEGGYIGVAVSVGPCVWVLHCSAFCNETRWVLFVFEVVLFFKISYFFFFYKKNI